MALVGYWYDGLWKILSFAIQMILILLTGYALAMAPAVRRALAWIAGFAPSPESATVLEQSSSHLIVPNSRPMLVQSTTA